MATARAAAVAERRAAAAVLRVTGVEKRFHRGVWPRRRAIEVLKGATLEVRAGELVGLVGENGSGKSTLMQIVVGLLRRDGGELERPERLGYCPQVPMLWDKLTVDEHVELW
jgi:ABC-2 type transport system ATP-binding protein